LLSWRDHIHRSFLQFFEGEDRVAAARSLQGIGDMVARFVVGNFVLGILLAVLSSVAFWWIKLPYPLLAGPVSGFLSLVPYVGLPLALLLRPSWRLPVAARWPVFDHHLRHRDAPPHRHEPALSQNRRLARALEPARRDVCPDAVGFLWDAGWPAAGIPLTAGIKAVCDNVRGLRPFGKFWGIR